MEYSNTIKQSKSVPEIANLFGVSEHYVRQQIYEGKLPYFQVGKKFRIYPDDFQNLLESKMIRNI